MGRSGMQALYSYVAVSTWGLSTLAWKLKTKDPTTGDMASDFQPTTLATHGSFVLRLFGRRRIGHVFAWDGSRQTYNVTQRVETKGSKKKNRATGQIVHSMAGWHLLCVGPATKLYKIYADGKVIFDTEINSTTTPSGSTLPTSDGSGDSFRIFWGEADQPINTNLAASGAVEIASAWPFLCYVEWIRKTLGAAPRWPQIEYEVEVLFEPAAAVITGGIFHFDAAVAASVEESAGDPAENTDNVSKWIDQSASNFDIAQGSGATRPNYLTPAGINGIPAVDFTAANGDSLTFNGGNGFLPQTQGELWAVIEPDSLPAAGEYGVVAQVSVSNLNNRYIVFGIDENGAVILEYAPLGVVLARAKTPNGLVAVGDAAVVRWSSNGARWQIEVNGELQTLTFSLGTNTGGWWGNVTNQFRLTLGVVSRSAGSSWAYEGRIGEVIAYAAELTDEERVEMREFLGSKWTVTIAGIFSGSFAQITGSLLFDPFPHGIGLSSAGFDIDSLNDVSAELVAEGLELHMLARDGEEAVALLAGLMQDAGVLLYRHPVTGLLTFALQRQGTATAVPTGMIIDGVENAEIVTQHQDLAASRLEFLFPDVARAYRETGITIDADGVGDRLSAHRVRKIQLVSVTDAATAAIVAERRSQEELAGSSAYTLRLGREARAELVPGSLLSIADVADVLRVLEVKPDLDANAVEIRAIPDYYGSEPSTFTPSGPGSSGSGGTPVAADEQATFIEVPEHLLDPGDPTTIIVPRVRAHDQTAYANIHLSGDGTTYQLADSDFGIHTGGQLLEAIEADDAWEIDTGPTLTLLGPPDADAVDDLTADEPNWRLGRQLVLIGEELFFLKKLTAVSGTTYRLDGLIRARYDTERAAHAIGAAAYIFSFAEIAAITDALIVAGASLRVKPQPVASTALALASVTAITKTIYGKGLVPPKPCALDVIAPVLGAPSYSSGDDVEFAWASRLSFPSYLGAGMNPCGSVPVGAGALHANTVFEVRVYDAGAVLVATYVAADGVTENGWTYANADLQADLGGETDFSIEVYEVRAGLYSAPAEFSMEVV